MIKNIIFDIDGTLIDNEEVILLAFQKSLKKYGYDYEIDDLRFSYGIPGLVSIKKLGVKEFKQVFDEWVLELLEVNNQYKLFSGIEHIVEKLHDKGFNLGIVTSKNRSEYNSDFAKMNINKFFPVSICADEVENPKPHKDPLVLAMKKMNANPEETIYIGDSVYDFQSSQGAGIKFGVATWGSKIKDYNNIAFVFEKPEDILKLNNK